MMNPLRQLDKAITRKLAGRIVQPEETPRIGPATAEYIAERPSPFRTSDDVNYCEKCKVKLTSKDLRQAKRCLGAGHKLTYRAEFDDHHKSA